MVTIMDLNVKPLHIMKNLMTSQQEQPITALIDRVAQLDEQQRRP